MSISNCPISYETLTTLCDTYLSDLFKDVSYQQFQVDSWNKQIIQHLLESLITFAPQYKWILTSSIIETSSNISFGVHSAQGAYWDCKKDGIITYEWSNPHLRIILGFSWIQL